MQQHTVLLTVALVYDLDEVRFKEKVNQKGEAYHVFDFDALRKASIESAEGLAELSKRGVELRFGAGLNKSKLVHAQAVRPVTKPAAKVEASNIDAAFASMSAGDDFSLDVTSPAETKFRELCDKHGYSAVELANGTTLADRIKELIQANGTSTDTHKRMNAKLKSFGQQTLSATDWKICTAAAK